MKKELTREKFDEIVKASNAEAVRNASKEELDELYVTFVELTQLLNEVHGPKKDLDESYSTFLELTKSL